MGELGKPGLLVEVRAADRLNGLGTHTGGVLLAEIDAFAATQHIEHRHLALRRQPPIRITLRDEVVAVRHGITLGYLGGHYSLELRPLHAELRGHPVVFARHVAGPGLGDPLGEQRGRVEAALVVAEHDDDSAVRRRGDVRITLLGVGAVLDAAGKYAG